MPREHQPLCADNVAEDEKNTPEGYVYCGICLAPLPASQPEA